MGTSQLAYTWHFAEGRTDAKHQIRDVDFRRGRAGEGRVVVDLPNNQVAVDVSRKSTTELGLNRSESAAFDAIYDALAARHASAARAS